MRINLNSTDYRRPSCGHSMLDGYLMGFRSDSVVGKKDSCARVHDLVYLGITVMITPSLAVLQTTRH